VPFRGRLQELFLLDPNVVFLNHGAFGACPRPVFDEYQRLQRELEHEPVQFLNLRRRFPDLIAAARARLADYVGAQAADVLLAQNATTALNVVAHALELRPGDEVVATTHEYGANHILWRRVCERVGARYVEVETRPARAVEDLIGALTERTRALFVSHITSPSALVFPIAKLCAAARAAGVFTIVDGAHAPGQIELDVEAVGADVYVGDCHKWLCAPKGSGFLHAQPEAQALLEPRIVSWDWEETAWADRHRWAGTRDPSAHLAVAAAIDFQAEHQWESVRERCHALAVAATRRLGELGLEPTAESDDEYAQMVAFRLAPCDAEAVERRLFAEYRIDVAAQTWRDEPTLRVSFQGYNDESDLDALVDALRRLGL
jgi:isopenicillin-N epimerase